jgi:hypothetical protein
MDIAAEMKMSSVVGGSAKNIHAREHQMMISPRDVILSQLQTKTDVKSLGHQIASLQSDVNKD